MPGNAAGMITNFDLLLPTWLALPAFLSATNYRNPTDNLHCAFQPAHATPLPALQWLPLHPDHLAAYNAWTPAQHSGHAHWLDVFPLAAHLGPTAPSTPLFVDIGGGTGQQCAALKARFPRLRGRVVLQDRPAVLELALRVDGVEPMAHDFWAPQPVLNARAYYMRNILRDYGDEKCMALLRNTVSAMGPESVVLIDEVVLPNERAPWRATQVDVTMMAALASGERSEGEWEGLLERAGVRVVGVWRYVVETGESIIMVVPRSGALPGMGMGGGI